MLKECTEQFLSANVAITGLVRKIADRSDPSTFANIKRMPDMETTLLLATQFGTIMSTLPYDN